MSDKELSRLEILRDLGNGRLTTPAAAELLGLERRQVQRLAKAYQEQGATALISKTRGRPSNRQAGLRQAEAPPAQGRRPNAGHCLRRHRRKLRICTNLKSSRSIRRRHLD
jgi:transposase